jgi:stage V sporulation protein SpoVS
MHTLSKDRPDSPSKIDGAMAGVLSWEARGDAIAAGAKPRTAYKAMGFS